MIMNESLTEGVCFPVSHIEGHYVSRDCSETRDSSRLRTNTS